MKGSLYNYKSYQKTCHCEGAFLRDDTCTCVPVQVRVSYCQYPRSFAPLTPSRSGVPSGG